MKPVPGAKKVGDRWLRAWILVSICHLMNTWPGASFLASLWLDFLICKVGVMTFISLFQYLFSRYLLSAYSLPGTGNSGVFKQT